MTALQIRLGSQLLPAFTTAVQAMTTWMSTSAEAQSIVTGVSSAVQSFMARLQDVDVGAVVAGVRGLVDAGRSAVETFGLGNLALAGLAVAFAPTLAGLASLTLSLGGLGIAAIKALPALAAHATAVATAGSTALAAVPRLYALAAGFVAASWPVLAVVAGVSALAAGAYLLYRNWEPVTAWFAATWESVSGWFAAAWKSISGVVTAMASAARETLWDSWAPLRELFGGLWDGVTGTFTSAWTAVSGVVDQIAGAVDRVGGVLRTLGVIPAADVEVAATGHAVGQTARGAPGAALLDHPALPAPTSAPGVSPGRPATAHAIPTPGDDSPRRRESTIRVFVESDRPVRVDATPDRDDDLEIGLNRLGMAN